MPKKKRSYGSRLRTRAGSSVRKRWTRIVSEMKKEHKRPSRSSPSVKRKSTGVWRCVKCGYTYTGGAYIPRTKTGLASHARTERTI